MAQAAEQSNIVRLPPGKRRRSFERRGADLPPEITRIWQHPRYCIDIPQRPELPAATPELALITAMLDVLKPADRRKVRAALAGRSNERPDDAALAAAAEYVIRLGSAV